MKLAPEQKIAIFRNLFKGRDDVFAVRNAEYCQNYHKTADVDGNPSTGVHLLIREMNEATREYFKLALDTNK